MGTDTPPLPGLMQQRRPDDHEGAGDVPDCPLCGYDLRGLPETPGSRCPECGHGYDLNAIRQAKADRSEWSFENAVRRRKRALLRTSLGTIWPGRFWRRMKPTMPIVSSRLKAFAIGWFVILIAGSMLLMLGCTWWKYHEVWTRQKGDIPVVLRYFPSGVPDVVGMYPPALFARRAPAVSAYSMSDAFMVVFRLMPLGGILKLAVLVALWPFVARGAIALFGVTLKRAGIRTGHLWRCVVYPMPPLVMIVLAALPCALFYNREGFFPAEHSALMPLMLVLGLPLSVRYVLLALLVMSTLHLVATHAKYLRLLMAVRQALLVQAVTCAGLMVVAWGLAFVWA